jgi:hypothetical protein
VFFSFEQLEKIPGLKYDHCWANLSSDSMDSFDISKLDFLDEYINGKPIYGYRFDTVIDLSMARLRLRNGGYNFSGFETSQDGRRFEMSRKKQPSQYRKIHFVAGPFLAEGTTR